MTDLFCQLADISHPIASRDFSVIKRGLKIDLRRGLEEGPMIHIMSLWWHLYTNKTRLMSV